MINQLQKITVSNGLAKAGSSQPKAVERRLQMLGMSEVMQSLRPLYRKIFEASTKKPIAEYGNKELAEKSAVLANSISRNAGIKTLSEDDIVTFCNSLMTYYPQYTLQEVKLAFEVLHVGELNEYLPADRYGNPDKSHYGTFNLSYIGKIMQAYGKLRSEVEAQAYSAMPKKEEPAQPESVVFYNREWRKNVIRTYLQYKYTGKVSGYTSLYRVYETLDNAGLAEPYEITENDRKQAVNRMLRKVHDGVLKEFIGECLRYQRTKHHDVEPEADFIAREKALYRTFDRMIEEEIQITEYIPI